MATIKSAAEVRAVFPEAVIDEFEFHNDTGPLINAYADSHNLQMSGLPT